MKSTVLTNPPSAAKRKGAGSSLYFYSPIILVLSLFAFNACDNSADPAGEGIPREYAIATAAQWDDAINAIKSGGSDKSYTLTVNGTVSVPGKRGVKENDSATYSFGDVTGITVTLRGSGTLALSGPGLLLCLGGGTEDTGQKLIIDGPALKGVSNNDASLIYAKHAGVELRSGKITGNTNQGFGGGVDAFESDLAMTGGVIKGNTARDSSPNGGGMGIRFGGFSKTGGTIYGSDGGDDSNRVISDSGVPLSNKGAAVFYTDDFVINDEDDRRRETTLGENDNIRTGDDAGWEF
jgi:hypothetical protein